MFSLLSFRLVFLFCSVFGQWIPLSDFVDADYSLKNEMTGYIGCFQDMEETHDLQYFAGSGMTLENAREACLTLQYKFFSMQAGDVFCSNSFGNAPEYYQLGDYECNYENGAFLKNAIFLTSVDCKVSEWTSISECSESCGGGVLQQTRQVIRAPLGSGNSCPVILFQETSCNTESCPINHVDCLVSEWSQYSSCSVSCGSGIQSRFRSVVKFNEGAGALCPPLFEEVTCNTNVCDLDCAVSSWSEFTGCSSSCGGGYRSRSRSITLFPTGNGTICPNLIEQVSCNEQICPRDCVVSPWSAYSNCNTECGEGQKERHRTIQISPIGSGAACPSLLETISCDNSPCFLSSTTEPTSTVIPTSFVTTLAPIATTPTVGDAIDTTEMSTTSAELTSSTLQVTNNASVSTNSVITITPSTNILTTASPTSSSPDLPSSSSTLQLTSTTSFVSTNNVISASPTSSSPDLPSSSSTLQLTSTTSFVSTNNVITASPTSSSPDLPSSSSTLQFTSTPSFVSTNNIITAAPTSTSHDLSNSQLPTTMPISTVNLIAELSTTNSVSTLQSSTEVLSNFASTILLQSTNSPTSSSLASTKSAVSTLSRLYTTNSITSSSVLTLSTISVKPIDPLVGTTISVTTNEISIAPTEYTLLPGSEFSTTYSVPSSKNPAKISTVPIVLSTPTSEIPLTTSPGTTTTNLQNSSKDSKESSLDYSLIGYCIGSFVLLIVIIAFVLYKLGFKSKVVNKPTLEDIVKQLQDAEVIPIARKTRVIKSVRNVFEPNFQANVATKVDEIVADFKANDEIKFDIAAFKNQNQNLYDAMPDICQDHVVILESDDQDHVSIVINNCEDIKPDTVKDKLANKIVQNHSYANFEETKDVKSLIAIDKELNHSEIEVTGPFSQVNEDNQIASSQKNLLPLEAEISQSHKFETIEESEVVPKITLHRRMSNVSALVEYFDHIAQEK